MQVKAVHKFVRMSPRKLRVVAAMVSDLSPTRAVEVLPHVGKRAAEPLAKVIRSAIANAKVKGIREEMLAFKEIQINEGPRLKRGRAASRGRWHPRKRRMSHILVVLETKEEDKKGVRRRKNNQSKVSERPTKTKKGGKARKVAKSAKKSA